MNDVLYTQKNGPDPYGDVQQKREDLVNDIKVSIDKLSNLKSLNQLEIETARAKQASLEMEKKNKVQKYRLEQAQARMRKIEEEEKERCRKTAEIFKKFQENSCNGPFFQSLIDILTNFQGMTGSFQKNYLKEIYSITILLL